MLKVYYQSESLMITEQVNGITHSNGQGLAKMSDIEYFQHKMMRNMVQTADEVWVYHSQNRSFESIKNRNGTATILMSFLVSKGIHIRPDVAVLNHDKPTLFRFEDEKDHFLFQLKF